MTIDRVRLHITAVMLASLLAWGCTQGPDREALMANAVAARAANDHKSAIIHLRNALQSATPNAEARYLLGLSYLEVNEPLAAEQEFRRAIDLNKDPATVQPHLLRALLLQGEYDKLLAETEPQDGVEAPPSVEVLSARGVAQLSLGSIDEARATLQEALAISPASPEALLGLARWAVATQDTVAATKYVDLALQQAPRDLDGLLLKGDLLKLANEEEAALAAYKQASQYHPNNTTARLNIASIHLAADQYDGVMAQVQALRTIDPENHMANHLQGMVHFRKREYLQAKDMADAVFRLNPAHLPSRLLGGSVEYALGKYPQAIQHLQFVVDAAPDNLQARKLLAVVLLRERQIPQAIQILMPALELAPGDASLLGLAGEAFVQNREFGKAVTYFEKAIAIDPANLQSRNGLGLSRLAAGQSVHSPLSDGGNPGGDSYQTDTLTVLAQIENGEFDKAKQTLQALQERQPNSPLNYYITATLQTAQNKPAEARKALQKALQLSPDFFPATLKLARLEVQQGEAAAARQRLETLLKKYPEHLQTLLTLADLGKRLGASDNEVVSWLVKAKHGNPGSLQPTLSLANHYLRVGDARRAAEVAADAQTKSPDNERVLETLGNAQLRTGAWQEAATTFTRLVTLQPKAPLGFVKLAEAQIAMANDPGAAYALSKAIMLKPDLVAALAPLALIEARAGRFAEALRLVEKVSKLTNASASGAVLEGDVRTLEKKYNQAALHYEKALQQDPEESTAIKLHRARMSSKNDNADALLLKWIGDHPERITARLYLADVSLKAANAQSAVDQYEWIVKRQPNNVVALNNLAWSYLLKKDARSLTIAEKAYTVAPGEPLILDTYGWTLVQHGALSKGVDMLQRATMLAPEQAEIGYHYAVGLAQLGKNDTAVAELKRILTSTQDFPLRAEADALLSKLAP